MTTLFDDPDVMTHGAVDPEDQRAVRRLALGGALQLVRARKGWTVSEAAAHAGLAPMTLRRIEDGLDVREKSLAALDRLLEVPIGTVKRSLADDMLMVELLKVAGVDTRHVAADNAGHFLTAFADQTRTGSPRQSRVLRPGRVSVRLHRTAGPDQSTYLPGHGPVSAWPAITDEHREGLMALASHVPAVRPTDLEVVQRMVEQLTRRGVTPAIQELIQAAVKAMPDLITRQLEQAEEDIRAKQTEEDIRAKQTEEAE